MTVEGVPKIWTVLEPSKWPPAPAWMSYSTLTELEECPRRWALKSAEYSEVWEGRGYPRVPQSSVLVGQVVHSAIERVARALSEAGCESLQSESAVSALRQLGGYSAIVSDCMEAVFSKYEGNPRATPVVESLRQVLSTRVPELRSRVQRQVSRIKLAGDGSGAEGAGAGRQAGQGMRRPLKDGSHAELEVQDPELGWRGFVDLLTVSDSLCEIRDFKTGAVKDEHKLQLKLYAMLWSRDRELNPTGRAAQSLVLSYDEQDLQLEPPSAATLDALHEEIRERTERALNDATETVPEARPGQEQCQYCAVRHLCAEYWEWLRGEASGGELAASQYGDVEIELTSPHGPSSFDGRLLSGTGLQSGRDILFRTSNLQISLRSGQRLRVLNVQISDDSPDDGSAPIVATMTGTSEVFVLPEIDDDQ